MKIRIDGFDWDDGNRHKCRKHGVSIEEIEALFCGDHKVAPDLKHSSDEQRFIAVGRTRHGRPLFVGFTFRHSGTRYIVRPVTARYMHAKEVRAYEKKEKSSSDDNG